MTKAKAVPAIGGGVCGVGGLSGLLHFVYLFLATWLCSFRYLVVGVRCALQFSS